MQIPARTQSQMVRHLLCRLMNFYCGILVDWLKMQKSWCDPKSENDSQIVPREKNSTKKLTLMAPLISTKFNPQTHTFNKDFDNWICVVIVRSLQYFWSQFIEAKTSLISMNFINSNYNRTGPVGPNRGLDSVSMKWAGNVNWNCLTIFFQIVPIKMAFGFTDHRTHCPAHTLMNRPTSPVNLYKYT